MSESTLTANRSVPPARTVRQTMALVLLALVPGVFAQLAIFGTGKLVQIALAIVFAFGFEALMLRLRRQPMARFLGDFSAPVAAVLFALCLPPLTPWWLVAAGIGVAIVIAKQLFGGLGYNLFNPAMAGVAVVQLCFTGELLFGDSYGAGWPWLALAYTFGGIFLIWKRIIAWQAPFAMLITVTLLLLSALALSPPASANPLQSIFFVTALLGAFFIVTDPVTGCASPRGRLIFGAAVGALSWWIWQRNGNPLGLAFAVLAMNAIAPWIDRHSRPGQS